MPLQQHPCFAIITSFGTLFHPQIILFLREALLLSHWLGLCHAHVHPDSSLPGLRFERVVQRPPVAGNQLKLLHNSQELCSALLFREQRRVVVLFSLSRSLMPYPFTVAQSQQPCFINIQRKTSCAFEMQMAFSACLSAYRTCPLTFSLHLFLAAEVLGFSPLPLIRSNSYPIKPRCFGCQV